MKNKLIIIGGGSLLNVSSALGNNSFQLTSNGNVATITVPDGQYSEATLQSIIQTQINASGSDTSDLVIDISNQDMGYVTKLNSSSADISVDFSVRDGCQEQLDSQNYFIDFNKPFW